MKPGTIIRIYSTQIEGCYYTPHRNYHTAIPGDYEVLEPKGYLSRSNLVDAQLIVSLKTGDHFEAWNLDWLPEDQIIKSG